MQQAVDQYLNQDALVTLGFAPHHQIFTLVAMNLADAMMNTPFITPVVRRRLESQIAFLGYTVNRDDYWSPERGFSANPNMTSTVAAYQTMTGAAIPEHSMSKAWMKRGLDELKLNQLDHWSDDDGGWLRRRIMRSSPTSTCSVVFSPLKMLACRATCTIRERSGSPNGSRRSRPA